MDSDGVIRTYLPASIHAGENATGGQLGLWFDPADPLAVTLNVANGRHHPVTWLFGRELLQTGLITPAGCGDVAISPGDHDRLRIDLSSPHGCVTLLLGRQQVESFLTETLALVPLGAELSHVPGLIDDLVGALLDQQDT